MNIRIIITVNITRLSLFAGAGSILDTAGRAAALLPPPARGQRPEEEPQRILNSTVEGAGAGGFLFS